MKLFSVLRKDLLILIRDRAELLVLFLLPLAFIIPISLALGSGDGYGIHRDNRMTLLAVVDYDGGPRAEQLLTSIGESLALEKGYPLSEIRALGLAGDPDCAAVGKVVETPTPQVTGTVTVAPTETPTPTETPDPSTPTPGPTLLPKPFTANDPICTEKIARILLQRSRRTAALIIPPGFSQEMDAGHQIDVTLLYDPSADSTQFQQIQGVVSGAAIKVSVQNQVKNGLVQFSDLTVYAPEDVQVLVREQSDPPPDTFQQPAMRLEKVLPANSTIEQTPDTYQQTIPGYTIMYVFFIITSLTASIRAEKLLGTLRRLRSLPVGRAELLGGKLLATIVVGVIQVLILFGIGSVLFQLSLGRDPLAFLALTIALVTAATTLGLAISTTGLRGAGLAAPLVIAALLGGCMFPLDLLPPFLRALSYAMPHSWALTGYQNLMVRGQGLQEVLPQIGVLLGFALLFFLIAFRRFSDEI